MTVVEQATVSSGELEHALEQHRRELTEEAGIPSRTLDSRLLSIESGYLQGNRLLGPVTLTTRNRTIELDDISGPVTLTNRNGAVSV